ncbi:MAG: hypothetical protein RIR41_2967 [Pseudomonadota bacterium]
MSTRSYDIAGGVLAAAMILGPLALAPAYGPYVPPGTAQDVNEATTGERNPGPAAPVSDSPAVRLEGEHQ